MKGQTLFAVDKQNKSTEKAVQAIKLPYVPKKVPLENLDENGLLILGTKEKPETLETIKKVINENIKEGESPNNLFSKKIVGTKFSIFVSEGEYFARLMELGAGKYGKVTLLYNLKENKWYALKVLTYAKEKDHKYILAQYEHVALLHAKRISAEPIVSRSPPSKQHLQYLIPMELAEGNGLHDLIGKVQEEDNSYVYNLNIPPVLRMQIGIDLIKSTFALTKLNLLHRDIKPENFTVHLSNLLIPKLSTTLIDLGFTRQMNNEGKYVTDLKGSPIFLAPSLKTELLKFFNLQAKVAAFKENLQETQPHLSKKEIDDKAMEFLNKLPQEEQQQPAVYNKETEIFALGMTLAQLFGLLDLNSIPDYDEWTDANESWVTKKGSPFFMQNKMLPQKQLEQVLDLINKMTAIDPKQKCSMEEAITNLEKILHEYILEQKEEAKIKIGMFDVNHYLASDPAKQEDLINEYKNLDAVVLIDSANKEHNKPDYLKAKRDLENVNENMLVSSQVYFGNNVEDIKNKIQEDLKNLSFPSEMIEHKAKVAPRFS